MDITSLVAIFSNFLSNFSSLTTIPGLFFVVIGFILFYALVRKASNIILNATVIGVAFSILPVALRSLGYKSLLGIELSQSSIIIFTTVGLIIYIIFLIAKGLFRMGRRI